MVAATLSLLATVAAAPAHADVSAELYGVQNHAAVPYAPLHCAGCVNGVNE